MKIILVLLPVVFATVMFTEKFPVRIQAGISYVEKRKEIGIIGVSMVTPMISFQ